MGRRISFIEGFKNYKRQHGLRRGVGYLIGYYGISHGQYREFEKQVRVALRANKKGFIFRPKRKR